MPRLGGHPLNYGGYMAFYVTNSVEVGGGRSLTVVPDTAHKVKLKCSEEKPLPEIKKSYPCTTKKWNTDRKCK